MVGVFRDVHGGFFLCGYLLWFLEQVWEARSVADLPSW